MDLLSDILSRFKLTGTLYFRTSFTSPWSIRVPAFNNVARFHIAHSGRCFVRIDPQHDPVLLEQGDLVIITRGAAHTLYCDPSTENKALRLDQVVEDSGFSGTGTLVYGPQGTDHKTQLVCGHFAFDSKLYHPLIDALPPFIHIKSYGETSGRWMESTLRIIGAEACHEEPGGDLITLKMSEIIFAQALRSHLKTEGANQPVLAAFADQRIARALKAIHEEAGYPWTLETLSKIAGLSRTAFITTFTRYLSMTPLNYITQWRMQIAKQLLVESNDSIIKIAEYTGYKSEASFGRIFKRCFDIAPASFRRQQREQRE